MWRHLLSVIHNIEITSWDDVIDLLEKFLLPRARLTKFVGNRRQRDLLIHAPIILYSTAPNTAPVMCGVAQDQK